MEPSNYRERPPTGHIWALAGGQSIKDADDASALAQAIVDTIRDPSLFSTRTFASSRQTAHSI